MKKTEKSDVELMLEKIKKREEEKKNMSNVNKRSIRIRNKRKSCHKRYKRRVRKKIK